MDKEVLDKTRAVEKLEDLKATLQSYGSILVAYSGGVDSAFLLKVAFDQLGDKAIALTAKSQSLPESELNGATELAKSIGVKHIIVDSNEVANPLYRKNPENRCYYCKTELYGICKERATKLGLSRVADGFNADDTQDYRPGRVAATEHNVASPLADSKLSKNEIRYLSNILGLSTWDKPNMACLSSRFPYGTEITPERLKKVELAEAYLKNLGFKQLRVRYYNESAKIELDMSEMPNYTKDIEDKVNTKFLGFGFSKTILDKKGYRTGSLNENLLVENKNNYYNKIELKTN